MKKFLYSTHLINFVLGLMLFVLLAILAGLWMVHSSPERKETKSFAGLGVEASGYAQARPGQRLHFPEDHGPHPDYRIEWWYLTANLQAADGTPYGVQWTLFRQAIAPPETADATADPSATSPWASRQLWMAHAALSTPQAHYVAERFARGMTLPDNSGQAGVEAVPFHAWLDDWQMSSAEAASGLGQLNVNARGDEFAYRLRLTAEGPLVLHGEAGFSQKSADGQGSMYYSQPFYRVDGNIRVAGEPVAVTGRAWLDREWSSQLLGAQQQGWDWFSLHLDDGHKLMAFRLRGGGEGENAESGEDAYVSGSWITPQGQVTPLQGDDLRLQPLTYSRVAGRRIPTRWRIHLPALGLDVTVRARRAERWMDTTFPYWEGNVSVEGSHAGEGYLEMTGYQ
ncbi:lipocalin-like domain-containing protein [Halomonas shantousis]